MTLTLRAQLEGYTERYARAWNRHDAVELCSAYAADADFVDVSGTIVHGREAIVEHHRQRFDSIFAGSSLSVTTVKVRLVTRSSAVVHGIWSMRGHVNATGDWLPLRTGMLLFVFARRNGDWNVVLSQSTALPAVTPS